MDTLPIIANFAAIILGTQTKNDWNRNTLNQISEEKSNIRVIPIINYLIISFSFSKQ